MKRHFLCLAVLLVLIPAVAHSQTPDSLKPFLPLVAQVKDYQGLLAGAKWERVYDDQFDPDAKPQYVANVPEINNVSTTHIEKVNGHNELVFNAVGIPDGAGEGLLAIGPKVSGDFAVEYEAELVSDNPCDMSIFVNFRDGPGFQFGGHANTENILTTVSPDAENLKAAGQHIAVANPIGNSPLIEKNRFYKIRLEVIDHEVRGLVDGKVIGKMPLDPKGWDGKTDVQPQIYTWNSVMRIKNAHTDERIKNESRLDNKEAWSKAFGDMKEEDLTKKLEDLAELMGDDDQTVRDAAQAMITGIGPLAIPALNSTVTNGSPEASQRASIVLKAIKIPVNQSGASPQVQPQQPAVQGQPMQIHIEVHTGPDPVPQ